MKKAIYDKLSSEDKKEYLRLNRVANRARDNVDFLEARISFNESHPMRIAREKARFFDR